MKRIEPVGHFIIDRGDASGTYKDKWKLERLSAMKKIRTFLLFIHLSILPFSLGAADAGDLSEVRKALMCTCDDCTMVLYDCNCGTADEMVATIRGMLDNGLGTSDVIQAYVARYGQVILSAPPKEGFDLIAWVVPFVILGAATGLVLMLLKRWTSDSPVRESDQVPLKPFDETSLTKVEQEMEELGI